MKRNSSTRFTCAAAALLLLTQAARAQTPPPPNAAAPAAPGTAPAVAPAAAPTAAPAAAPAAESAPLTREQISYLFGLEFGEQMHRVGITDQVSLDDVARGVQDGLQGKKASAADQKQVQEFARAQMLASIAATKKSGRDFLERNSHEKGVKTTASGLQY